MGAVRLGKINLKWCRQCNLPILESNECGACGSPVKRVKLTPPGDIRPAMKADLELVREQVEKQFGPGTGDRLFPDDKVVVLNSAPSDDRMDEVIADGVVLGALRFNFIRLAYEFLPRMRAAKYLAPGIKRSWVIVDQGAVEPILNSSNLLAPGVVEADKEIQKGDEVVLLTPDRKALATGSARMSGEVMNQRGRGAAVKVRWREEPGVLEPLEGGQDWNRVIEANKEYLQYLEDKAVRFIKRTVEEHSDKEPVVSYSGGKDSLATLDLVLKAGLKPKVMFVDTGLEFPETVKNVTDVVEDLYGLTLLTYDAGDAFWHSLEHYGPPGRDYRWCCKSCKLGPTSGLIRRNFPNGVLAFIGQRGKESEQRYRKQDIWDNPWVPGQLGASPIQKWNALEVWLHIFRYELPYNPLYDQGLARIGCWLCPSQSLSELGLVARHPDYDKWEGELKDFAGERGLEGPWLKFGLSRWNRLPKKMRVFLKEQGIEAVSGCTRVEDSYIDETLLLASNGPAQGMYIGRFSFELSDLLAPGRLLSILGRIETKKDHIEVARGRDLSARVYPDRIEVSGPGASEREVRRVFEVVYRSIYCVSCGVCVSRCPREALSIDPGTRRVTLDVENCVQCGMCAGKCPVIEFPPR